MTGSGGKAAMSTRFKASDLEIRGQGEEGKSDTTAGARASSQIETVQEPRFYYCKVTQDWLEKAAQLRGDKTFTIAMTILCFSRLRKSRTITLTGSMVERFGASRSTKYRALKILAKAELVRVQYRGNNRNPKVTIIDYYAREDDSVDLGDADPDQQ